MATLLLDPPFPGLSWDRRVLSDTLIPGCGWVLSPSPSWEGRGGDELTCRWVGHLGHNRDQTQNVEGLHVFDTRGGRGTSSSRTGLLPRELQYGLTDRAVWSPDLRSQQPCWCDQERWVGVNTDHQEQGWDRAFPRGLYMTLPCGHREPECMSGGTSALSPGTPNSFCSHYRQ